MFRWSFSRLRHGAGQYAPVLQGKARCNLLLRLSKDFGGVPVTAGHATVTSLCFTVWEIIETGENRGNTGLNRDATGPNWGSPKPNPVKPLGPGSSRRSPGEAPIHSRIARCRPGYPRFTQDHPGRASVLSRSVPVSPRFSTAVLVGPNLHFIKTGKARRFSPVLPEC